MNVLLNENNTDKEYKFNKPEGDEVGNLLDWVTKDCKKKFFPYI